MRYYGLAEEQSPSFLRNILVLTGLAVVTWYSIKYLCNTSSSSSRRRKNPPEENSIPVITEEAKEEEASEDEEIENLDKLYRY